MKRWPFVTLGLASLLALAFAHGPGDPASPAATVGRPQGYVVVTVQTGDPDRQGEILQEQLNAQAAKGLRLLTIWTAPDSTYSPPNGNLPRTLPGRSYLVFTAPTKG